MESNRDPSAYQPNALPLGQTGSHFTPSQPVRKAKAKVRTLGALSLTDNSINDFQIGDVNTNVKMKIGGDG